MIVILFYHGYQLENQSRSSLKIHLHIGKTKMMSDQAVKAQWPACPHGKINILFLTHWKMDTVNLMFIAILFLMQ